MWILNGNKDKKNRNLIMVIKKLNKIQKRTTKLQLNKNTKG
jgi:hypothetical protein